MVGVPLHATLCICPQISRETSSVQTLQKVLSIKLTEVPLWVHAHAHTRVTSCVVHVKSAADYGNLKITQHALKTCEGQSVSLLDRQE